jgi:hypothetical protein
MPNYWLVEIVQYSYLKCQRCHYFINHSFFQDEAWNQRCKVFSDDIDRKLDRLELKSLKEWLLRRLKALNDQLNEQNQGHVRRLKALNDKLKKQNQAHVRRLNTFNDKLLTG